MSLTLIGTNYKYADLKTREKFAFSKKDILSALGALMEKELIKGGVLLSTCQRMEIYAQAPSPAPLKDFLLDFKGLSSDAENFLYIRENEEAVFHLFFVSAGLDSQMIGENEILHQVKEAIFSLRVLRLLRLY